VSQSELGVATRTDNSGDGLTIVTNMGKRLNICRGGGEHGVLRRLAII